MAPEMFSLLPNPRYERKFVLQGLSLADALALVRRHPAAFREAYPARMVNNVYLDTPGLNSYHDHVQGLPNRSKIRVRWYGENSGPIPIPVLERKLKRGLVSGKMAQPMPPIFVNGHHVRQVLENAFSSEQIPESWRAQLHCLEPSLFNQYRRHYFVSADNHFRLTLDSQLRFAPPQYASRGEPNWPCPFIVFELKFAPEFADSAATVTNCFPFRLGRCSKYVLGIDRIGF